MGNSTPTVQNERSIRGMKPSLNPRIRKVCLADFLTETERHLNGFPSSEQIKAYTVGVVMRLSMKAPNTRIGTTMKLTILSMIPSGTVIITASDNVTTRSGSAATALTSQLFKRRRKPE